MGAEPTVPPSSRSWDLLRAISPTSQDVLGHIQVGRRAHSLGGDGLDHRQHVLHAMAEFQVQRPLPLLRLDAGERRARVRSAMVLAKLISSGFQAYGTSFRA